MPVVRRVVETLVLVAIGVLLLGTFALDGLLVPEVVSSGSMAPALLGPHRTGRCSVCGQPLLSDAVDSGADAAVCPNCGWPGNPLVPGATAGDRLLVERASLSLWPAKRWEVLVMHCPDRADEYCVKRVVGLPGEKVEIRGGAVYINGQIARKTLAQQRALAVPVNDAACWPVDPRLPPRWRADPASYWGNDFKGFRYFKREGATDGTIDWLSYVHWRRKASDPTQVQEAPIRDDDPINPNVSRRLNDVTDLMLVAQLSATGSGRVYLRCGDGGQAAQISNPKSEISKLRCQISLAPKTGRIELQQDGRQIQAVELGHPILTRSTELLLSTFDRQVLLALDGQVVLTYWLAPAEEIVPNSRPLAIGSDGIAIDIERLQVMRNVYYTPPRRLGAATTWQLKSDEYFVLGDNSPVSVDSRTWTGGQPIPARLLVGRIWQRIRRGL